MNFKPQNYDYNFSIILTACVNPPLNMPFLVRAEAATRIKDYEETFNKWCKNKLVKKIIFIENSDHDLSSFHEVAKKFPSKDIEIISSNSNITFSKNLGKGYGEYLILKEVFAKSRIVQNTDFFLKVTGRYYIKNFNQIFKELTLKRNDISVYIKNNLTYADSHVVAGSKNFFLNYIIPEAANTNDTKGIFIEHCVAKATLKGINDNLTFNHLTVYPDVEGTIATNNKKIKNNIFKKIKLFFFGKIKNYFLSHKKY